MNKKVNVFWFRRDLRLTDNHGLHQALMAQNPVLPIFILDPHILNQLEDASDPRVSFIHRALEKIHQQLNTIQSGLHIYYETPENAFRKITEKWDVQGVYYNEDYEPYPIQRDKSIENYLASQGIPFFGFQDHVIMKPGRVLKADGTPYTVYTPFSKSWKKLLKNISLQDYTISLQPEKWVQDSGKFLSLENIGFKPTSIEIPKANASDEIIKHYAQKRDFPAENGTSKLGIHLRFGTISIRKLVQKALLFEETFLNELIWREFFMHILWHFPNVVHQNFRSKYDGILWRNNEIEFRKWCSGDTGIPLVDAGMRELNTTGFMHNRVRMVVASFLCKNLLIDWRWGEGYFAQKLLDYELASNNGNWQWAAGTGCDAAPYFRVFNALTQQQKFDPYNDYVNQWVPEWQELTYQPIVDLKASRVRALEVYKRGIQDGVK